MRLLIGIDCREPLLKLALTSSSIPCSAAFNAETGGGFAPKVCTAGPSDVPHAGPGNANGLVHYWRPIYWYGRCSCWKDSRKLQSTETRSPRRSFPMIRSRPTTWIIESAPAWRQSRRIYGRSIGSTRIDSLNLASLLLPPVHSSPVNDDDLCKGLLMPVGKAQRSRLNYTET